MVRVQPDGGLKVGGSVRVFPASSVTGGEVEKEQPDEFTIGEDDRFGAVTQSVISIGKNVSHFGKFDVESLIFTLVNAQDMIASESCGNREIEVSGDEQKKRGETEAARLFRLQGWTDEDRTIGIETKFQVHVQVKAPFDQQFGC